METDKVDLKQDIEESKSSEFKKPVLVGSIGKLPRKIDPDNCKASKDDAKKSIEPEKSEKDIPRVENNPEPKKKHKEFLSPAELMKEQSPIPYKEPKWSGLPPERSGYKFEVLKSGLIVETIDLTTKPFYVFGRLPACDIIMAHPTISRYHAVLQYKARENEDSQPIGFYIYDLGSSHGTIINKTPLKAKHYVRLRVGHMIKLGCSTRHYILQGPDEDMEEESPLSLTEMKELRKLKKEQFEKEMMLAKIEKEKEEKEKQKRIEQEGISWGMSEDAEEETDLSENPYAQSTNEELYLDDPKKTLRGFFEREGCTLEYDCQERGIGQFVCRVELPIEDARGNSVTAEVIHKGKKKDAVVQCALEACRIIDRHGLLRQAKHESRKRKMKNWKDDDYYDSDDDTYLDRTGVVEKKREKRMKELEKETSNSSGSNQSGKAMTYDELLDKCRELRKTLEQHEKKLNLLREQGKSKNSSNNANDDEDELEQFMSNLGKQTISNKTEISKTKMDIQKVKMELEKTEKLSEIAKPAILPPLISTSTQSSKSTIVKKSGNSIFIAKKITKTTKKDVKRPEIINTSENDNFTVEMDSDEEDENTNKKIKAFGNPVNSTNEVDVPKNSSTQNKPKISKPVSSQETTKVFGPMRPPSNYSVPEGYFDQENDRDLPEITESEENFQ